MEKKLVRIRPRSMPVRNDGGFLLFETIVALLIAVIVLDLVIRLLASQHMLLYGSRDRLAAVGLAQRLLHEQRLRTDLTPERQQGMSNGMAWRVSIEAVDLARQVHSSVAENATGAAQPDGFSARRDQPPAPAGPPPTPRQLYRIWVEVVAGSGQKVDVEGLRSLPQAP